MNREYAKGLAKVKENDFLAAIEHFTLAIQENGNDIESYAERAVAYLNTDQFELSMFDMNRCIELDSKNSYRYSCRAFLKSKIGDTDGAIADYEIAVKLDPEDAIAYNNLGLAQESKGYQKKAEKSFEKSNQLIGYNPKRFDEGGKTATGDAADISKNQITSQPDSTVLKSEPLVENPTKSQVAKSVFTSKSGIKDFLKFIRNGFKIKE